MRIFALAIAAILLVIAGGGATVQSATVPHQSVVTGTIQSALCWADNFASGDAVGDVSGSFFVAFDCKNGKIAGGTWLILAVEENPDGTTAVLGTLRGVVVQGAFDADTSGRYVVVRDVSLRITEGTGRYATVIDGTGTLEATTNPERVPQFEGTLALTF